MDRVYNGFMPVTKEDMRARGIEQLDFVYIIGDAYIDHPSFGPAIISRVLESRGYTVGIISQPDWRDVNEFRRLGKPRLAFLISSGNIDSMVNHYTAAKKRRSEDAYTPGGKAGMRPDRAAIVYSNRAREAYRGVPVLLGGIEASLRRFAHYDYWDDRVRRSILWDSGADLIMYGMGERIITEVADALASGLAIEDITYIPGTCLRAGDLERIYDYELIPGFDEVSTDKKAYCKAFMAQYEEQDPIRGRRLVQPHGDGFLIANPPAMPLSREELDDVYALPYTRMPHPSYREHIPAMDEVEFSITSCRGCFGSCSFCALTFHQGRIVTSRSHASILAEAKRLTRAENFKGYIHDVGGPTANFRRPACAKQLKKGACADRQCLGYERCPALEVDHSDYLELLRKLRALDGVKKVFVRSGIRYDYVMYDRDRTFLRELLEHHVSGRLKVAPEHVEDGVLRLMGKPARELYDRFAARCGSINRSLGKEQYLVPYLMSSHPGSTMQSAVALAEYIRDSAQRPEQVQDFYPTPGTLSTCMYHTGYDPRTMQRVYVPRDPHEKELQRSLMQYFLPQYRARAREALKKAGREDLIGFEKHCLLPPQRKGDMPAGKQPPHSKPARGGGGRRGASRGRRR